MANVTNLSAMLSNESLCDDKNLSDWEWEVHHQLIWWLEGMGILLVGLIGVIFNIIAIHVLMSQEMVSIRFNNLVVCLAVVDNFFLLTSIFYHIGYSFGFPFQTSYWHQWIFAFFVYPWRAISMLCSTYITVALAFDRYQAVSNPSKYKASMRSQTSPLKCILRSTLPILCASILFNIPRFFDLRIQLQGNVDEGNSTNATRSEEYYLEGTEWRGNKYFVLWYVNVKFILFIGMNPFALLIYLSMYLFVGMST